MQSGLAARIAARVVLLGMPLRVLLGCFCGMLGVSAELAICARCRRSYCSPGETGAIRVRAVVAFATCNSAAGAVSHSGCAAVGHGGEHGVAQPCSLLGSLGCRCACSLGCFCGMLGVCAELNTGAGYCFLRVQGIVSCAAFICIGPHGRRRRRVLLPAPLSSVLPRMGGGGAGYCYLRCFHLYALGRGDM